MHHSQGWSSSCNLLGALKNTTPSSGEISLLEESSVQIKEDKDTEEHIKRRGLKRYLLTSFNHDESETAPGNPPLLLFLRSSPVSYSRGDFLIEIEGLSKDGNVCWADWIVFWGNLVILGCTAWIELTGPLTFDIRAQLHLSHLPLQEDVDPREVLCPNVRYQNCINSVEVADQLPETSLRVRAAIHQHREPVDGKKGTVAAAGREHVAAGAGQLEKTHRGGRRQEVEGRRRGEGTRDEGGEFSQGLHGRQHLWGIDVQRERTLQRLVSQESLPPLADVWTTQSQTEFGGGVLLIYELKTEQFFSSHPRDLWSFSLLCAKQAWPVLSIQLQTERCKDRWRHCRTCSVSICFRCCGENSPLWNSRSPLSSTLWPAKISSLWADSLDSRADTCQDQTDGKIHYFSLISTRKSIYSIYFWSRNSKHLVATAS